MFIGYFTYLFRKNLYSSLLPFLIELLMVTEVFHFLYCSLDQIHDLQIFSPMGWVFWSWLYPLIHKSFKFWWGSIYVACTFGIILKKPLTYQRFPPIFFYSFNFFSPSCVPCGILVSWSGIEPRLTAVKVLSLNHWITREFRVVLILKFRNLRF